MASGMNSSVVRTGVASFLCVLLVLVLFTESSVVLAQEVGAPAPAPAEPESGAGTILPSLVAPAVAMVVSFLARRF